MEPSVNKLWKVNPLSTTKPIQRCSDGALVERPIHGPKRQVIRGDSSVPETIQLRMRSTENPPPTLAGKIAA